MQRIQTICLLIFLSIEHVARVFYVNGFVFFVMVSLSGKVVYLSEEFREGSVLQKIKTQKKKKKHLIKKQFISRKSEKSDEKFDK